MIPPAHIPTLIGAKKNGKAKAAASKNAPKPRAQESIMNAFMKGEARSKISRPAPVYHRSFWIDNSHLRFETTGRIFSHSNNHMYNHF